MPRALDSGGHHRIKSQRKALRRVEGRTVVTAFVANRRFSKRVPAAVRDEFGRRVKLDSIRSGLIQRCDLPLVVAGLLSTQAGAAALEDQLALVREVLPADNILACIEKAAQVRLMLRDLAGLHDAAVAAWLSSIESADLSAAEQRAKWWPCIRSFHAEEMNRRRKQDGGRQTAASKKEATGGLDGYAIGVALLMGLRRRQSTEEAETFALLYARDGAREIGGDLYDESNCPSKIRALLAPKLARAEQGSAGAFGALPARDKLLAALVKIQNRNLSVEDLVDRVQFALSLSESA